MSDVARHYDTLLAAHYSWMFGIAFDDKVAEQQTLLEEFGLPERRGTAIDLGCGPGFQSIALADAGFASVVAIDTCPALLTELEAQRGSRAIESVRGDLRDFARHAPAGGADLIVCMGDTLTHLEGRADVAQLIARAYAHLAPGGRFILTFRDLSSELVGTDRFIPVRADDDRIMVCFLEYEPETVVVHDLVHERTTSGWSLAKSSYRKLRLALNDIAAEMVRAGFEITRCGACGRLNAVVGVRP